MEMSENVPKKRKARKLPKSLTTEEFQKLIKATPEKDKQARISFLLAYGSGLRLSEVTSLKKESIRLDTNPNMIQVFAGKGGVDRNVPVPKGWKKWMTEILPIKKSGRSLERNFKSACEKAKLNPLYSFHSLRHGFGTRLLESGVPLNQVQVLMGHSNISTTSIYTKARPLDALKSYEDLF